MNHRTREGLKYLIIDFCLFLIAILILSINKIIFLIPSIIAFGIFIRGIIHFIQRIGIKNNEEIDHANKFYDHRDHEYNVNFV